MRFGIEFFTWGPMALGAALIVAGILIGGSAGVLCIASGAGFCLLGICVMMSDMMIRMSTENMVKGGRKGRGPL